jgi:hypothetical protein
LVLLVPACAGAAAGGAPARLAREVGVEITTLRPRANDPNQQHFGGFSGLEVDAASGSLFALSDRGWLVRIARDGRHETSSVELLGLHSRNEYFLDSEALRRAPDGRWWLGFERYNRIEMHRQGWKGLLQKAVRRYFLQEIQDLPENDGIESIAALADGRIVAISETRDRARMLVLNSDGRVVKNYEYRSPLFPADAVATPEGGLLVLTRDFTLLPPTFITRLEYAAPGWEEQAVVQGRLLLALDQDLPPENYEGMALESGRDGMLRLWLISDDNFLPIQQTLLARLDVPADCLRAEVSCAIGRD